MVHPGRNSMTPLKPLLRYETSQLVELFLAYGVYKGFYPQYSVLFSSEKRPLPDNEVDQMLLNSAFPLRKAFEELYKALGDESVPELSAEEPPKKRKPKPKSRASEHPLVVLAFDEAHTLTELEDNGSWSRYGEMHRVIRGLHDFSLFSLFLSTSGTLFEISPTTRRDSSARSFPKMEVMLPFCELGFDQFSKYVDFHGPVKFSQVTSEEHLTSYGRPLCVLNAHFVRLQLTFVLDSLLTTSRDNRTQYSFLQLRSC